MNLADELMAHIERAAPTQKNADRWVKPRAEVFWHQSYQNQKFDPVPTHIVSVAWPLVELPFNDKNGKPRFVPYGDLTERNVHLDRITQAKLSPAAKANRNRVALFNAYHDVMGAERYRVTCLTEIIVEGKPTKTPWVLDKELQPDGSRVSFGYTPAQIVTPKIQAKIDWAMNNPQKNYHTYYTAISSKHHFLLVDDASYDSLEKMVAKGFSPVVVIESSPNNFQAIIKVQKLGSVHDKDISNRLSEYLNRNFGDKNMLGAIHPHRAPGCENKKQKHKKPDGSYPVVKLVSTANLPDGCSKALALSRVIEEFLTARLAAAPAGVQASAQLSKQDMPKTPATASEINAYNQHLADIMARFKFTDVDMSKLDGMIALRLRVTGHSQEKIYATLLECGPRIERSRQRDDWPDYAHRTAAYAFGLAGEAALAKVEKYRGQWQNIEKIKAATPVFDKKKHDIPKGLRL